MKRYDGKLHAIFAKADYERVDNVFANLMQCGFELTEWADSSQKDIIKDRIANSKAVIVFISSGSIQDVSVQDQIELAAQFEKQMIPFFLDDPAEFDIPDKFLLLFDGTSRIDSYKYTDEKSVIARAQHEIGRFFVAKRKKKTKIFKLMAAAAGLLIIVLAVGIYSNARSKSLALENLRFATAKVICYNEEDDEYYSQGSGFVVSFDVKVITNHHVVEGKSKYFVKMHDGNVFEAELLAVDEANDLAVLKASKDAVSFGYPALKFAYGLPAVGEKCYVGGYPQGIDLIVSDGIISSSSKTYTNSAGNTTDYLALTAAISPGNSGGAVINEKGKVIGIVTAKISDADNFGLSRPAKYAKELLKNIPD